ncbi:L-threonylcarbamoyladenylate synthase [Mobiluncus porci]|uniref:L-threonylcarbamoyladenylate synthase n=1 Tax=Mobiluncus porci TaxID=2652278 RepID=A0A7K0K113_9ACTO|nr:L-threonylcarbamoyladenylate synthase [Mobiluncus porci]MST49187.1 threonylcarbamoyl-AMP synthase [Mobiluncus porci]
MEIIKADGGLSAENLATIDEAVKSSKLLVMPTDTVYGIATIPFEPQAVERLQSAKGRGEDFPPPVLVSGPAALEELLALPNSGLSGMPRAQFEAASKLAQAFWPGPLTIIAKARPSLGWDLGKTGGTIALRMPNHPVALEILGATGPLAVTSANRHGAPPATNLSAATAYFWDKVAVYVDAGESPSGLPSTIVDVTRLDTETRLPRLIRQGGVSLDEISAALA